jgi:hypothetical protein
MKVNLHTFIMYEEHAWNVFQSVNVVAFIAGYTKKCVVGDLNEDFENVGNEI